MDSEFNKRFGVSYQNATYLDIKLEKVLVSVYYEGAYSHKIIITKDAPELINLNIDPPEHYCFIDNELVILPEYAAQQLARDKQDLITHILEFAEDARTKLAGNPSRLQANAWAAKEARAHRIKQLLAANTQDVEHNEDWKIVQLECIERGRNESVTDLISLQLSKSSRLSSAVSIIDGMTSAALKDVENCKDGNSLELLKESLKKIGANRLQQLINHDPLVS